MSDNQKKPIFTKEGLLERAKSLAKPIDFDALVSEGVIEKKGRKYKILSMDKLPQHARDKIREISSDSTVKFSNVTKSAEKLVEKLSK